MDEDFMIRLRKAMDDRKISASELSRISGVGKSDISYYLKGRYVPKQDKCYMLAKALGCDPGWLMTGYEPSNHVVENIEEKPKNDDIRLLIRGLNKLSPEQVERAKEMMKLMFDKYFDEEGNDET